MRLQTSRFKVWVSAVLFMVAALWIVVPAFHIHTDDTTITNTSHSNSHDVSKCLICSFISSSFVHNAQQVSVSFFRVDYHKLLLPVVEAIVSIYHYNFQLRGPPQL